MISKIINIIAIILISGLFLTNCSSNKNVCQEDKPQGNLGNSINSNKDEKYLSLKNDVLFFYSAEPNKQGLWLFVDLSKPKLNASIADDYFNNLTNLNGKIGFDSSNIVYSANESSKKTLKSKLLIAEIEGAAIKEFRDLNEDFAFKNSINPTVSPDGKLLVFASPASGGKGGLDLYVSKKIDENNWGEPINISAINSEKDDNMPFIADNGKLYFATKAFSKNDKYDIAYADSVALGEWANVKILPPPINSNFEELYPVVKNNKIYLTSNRSGGCGFGDIYSFQLCGDVKAKIKALSEKGIPMLNGEITLIDKLTNEKISQTPDSSGAFHFTLIANRTYNLNYSNECFKDYLAKQTITTKCNDTAVEFMNISIILPGAETVFSFESYKCPFFVSGYYYPNTAENLEALKTKFAYNIFGANESVKYIEKPNEKHVEYAEIVDDAINSAVNFLLDKINYLKSPCAKKEQNMSIEINGYADPRPFSNNAKYIDETIDDEELNIKAERNEKMTNQLLSQLRAYFTAKTLQAKLENNESYQALKSRIIWRINGKGIDDTPSLDNELKRRIDIKISIE